MLQKARSTRASRVFLQMISPLSLVRMTPPKHLESSSLFWMISSLPRIVTLFTFLDAVVLDLHGIRVWKLPFNQELIFVDGDVHLDILSKFFLKKCLVFLFACGNQGLDDCLVPLQAPTITSIKPDDNILLEQFNQPLNNELLEELLIDGGIAHDVLEYPVLRNTDGLHDGAALSSHVLIPGLHLVHPGLVDE